LIFNSNAGKIGYIYYYNKASPFVWAEFYIAGKNWHR